MEEDGTIRARSSECISIFRSICCSLEYPASGETHSRSGSVLVQKSGHVDDDEQILRWMHSSRWMDERVATSVKCWSGIEGKMPEISRESELSELVENWTCLNALERKIWKMNHGDSDG